MTDSAWPRLYIDTNILIGAFESDSEASADRRDLFLELEKKPGWAATSDLTLAELAAHGEVSLHFYMGLLVANTFISVLPVTRETLMAAGLYRHGRKAIGRSVKLPDAIHIVTADRAGCDFLLSADKRFVVPDTIKLLQPDAAGLAIIDAAPDA